MFFFVMVKSLKIAKDRGKDGKEGNASGPGVPVKELSHGNI